MEFRARVAVFGRSWMFGLALSARPPRKEGEAAGRAGGAWELGGRGREESPVGVGAKLAKARAWTRSILAFCFDEVEQQCSVPLPGDWCAAAPWPNGVHPDWLAAAVWGFAAAPRQKVQSGECCVYAFTPAWPLCILLIVIDVLI